MKIALKHDWTERRYPREDVKREKLNVKRVRESFVFRVSCFECQEEKSCVFETRYPKPETRDPKLLGRETHTAGEE